MPEKDKILTLSNLRAFKKLDGDKSGDVSIPATGSNGQPVYFSKVNTVETCSYIYIDTSLFIGCDNTATGEASSAIGYFNTATGEASSAIGYFNTATGADKFAYDEDGIISCSVAIGANNRAVYADLLEGTTLAGIFVCGSIAMGLSNTATGAASSAMGLSNTATGAASSAIGYNNTATGEASSAIGYNNTATGGYSSAIGYFNTATGGYSSAIGCGSQCTSTSSSCYSVALGYYARTSEDKTIMLGGTTSYVSKINAAVSITVTSDERDKTDIASIDDDTAYEFLTSLSPVTYKWNPRSAYEYMDEVTNKDGTISKKISEKASKYDLGDYDKEAWKRGDKAGHRRRIGLTAQDIEAKEIEFFGDLEHFDLVNDNLYDRIKNGEEIPEDVESQKGVVYSNFIPLLISAVKHQKNEINELKAEIAELKEQIKGV